MIYLKVAVPAPLMDAFTYSSTEPVAIGSSVEVPFGKGRFTRGVVLGTTEDAGTFEIKPIKTVIEEFPPLSEKYLTWATWLAHYYKYPLGQVMDLAFPPLTKHGRANSKKKSILPEVDTTKTPPLLTTEQQVAVSSIEQSSDFQVHLLHGVTGSGKTEVYLRLFADCLKRGKQGMFLLPEISLTPQLLARFSERFGDQIALIHSQLTEREKTNQWWDMVEGRKKILIGARSALFCPVPDLGLIILDEEHETSYKQDEKLKYHARDAAIMLARELNCPVVLGSATPSLESWYNAKTDKYRIHRMRQRVENRAFPELLVVDLKKENQDRKDNPDLYQDIPFWMSRLLYEKIVDRLQKREQIALFLNRRGVAQSVICNSCGLTVQCPNCSVSLTLHVTSHMHCHYCGYHENRRDMCKECNVGELIPLGLGTEKIEKDLQQLFPKARLARADRDEIDSREAMEELVTAMENEEVDILIGTQMIAKGLDFPKLSLVSLVLADIGFNVQDFRATERSYQLITQVGGRAGRHQLKGEVILQTYQTFHPAIQHAQRGSFDDFAEEELGFRQELSYPPFGRMAHLRIQAIDRKKAAQTADNLARFAQTLQKKHELFKEVEILGPAESALFRLRGKFRYQIFLKAKSAKVLSIFVDQILAQKKLIQTTTKVLVDIDPLQTL